MMLGLEKDLEGSLQAAEMGPDAQLEMQKLTVTCLKPTGKKK